jgi:SPP1 family predicted phage head-tail adaptor
MSQRVPRLDRRVTFIQAVTETGDSNEDKITEWEEIGDFPTVWAEKMERGGSEHVVADRVTYAQPTQWMIRWRDDLNVRMRLVYETQVYEILAITEGEERRRFLKLITSVLDNISFT